MLQKSLKTIFSSKGLAFLIPGVFSIIFFVLYRNIGGISFLMQLSSLVCCGWIVFYATLLLSKSKSRWRLPATILKWLILLLVAVLLVLFLIVEINIIAHHNGDAEIPDAADTLIVLGCGIRGETPSLMLRYRLETALTWLQDHPESVAVLCGGQGPDEDITEAEAMRRWLVERGIDNHRLILEDTSESTRENIENASAILKQLRPEAKDVVVVSTGFHLFRSKKLCNFEGYNAYGLSAELPEIPLFALNYYCREFASVFFMYGSEIFA